VNYEKIDAAGLHISFWRSARKSPQVIRPILLCFCAGQLSDRSLADALDAKGPKKFPPLFTVIGRDVAAELDAKLRLTKAPVGVCAALKLSFRTSGQAVEACPALCLPYPAATGCPRFGPVPKCAGINSFVFRVWPCRFCVFDIFADGTTPGARRYKPELGRAIYSLVAL